MKNKLKVRALVLKVASRCNLNCTYCYVYNLGDTTYKSQPKIMSDKTVDSILIKVKAHCLAHQLESFTFIFHGGEPLLTGQEFYHKFVTKANEYLMPSIRPIFTLQTNGTLLTEEWCALFDDLRISIGISMDGNKEMNDKNRIHHNGKGSYDEIKKGFDIAMKSAHLKIKPGTLTVINIKNDPLETYYHFKSIDVTNVDFLFPEATYEKPALGFSWDPNATLYADWLITIFDKWFHEPNQRMSIRIFENIIALILGYKDTLDTTGTGENEVLVIETDGGIEPIGSLKVCGHGFTKLGANVARDELDEAINTDLARLYHLSGQKLCSKCQYCPIKNVCGGGYLPHRFSVKNGFDNPSVYCKDLMKLITHIQNTILENIPEKLQREMDIDRLTYEQLSDYFNYVRIEDKVNEELLYGNVNSVPFEFG